MEESSDDTVSRLLEAVTGRRSVSARRAVSLVYGELRVLAHRQRRRWDASGMLNTTALVHEAYLKLVKQRRIHLETRGHFFALAATAIRHIVSNYARDRQAKKRGRGVRTVSLNDVATSAAGELRVSDQQTDLLVAIDEALDRLERVSPRQRGDRRVPVLRRHVGRGDGGGDRDFAANRQAGLDARASMAAAGDAERGLMPWKARSTTI